MDFRPDVTDKGQEVIQDFIPVLLEVGLQDGHLLLGLLLHFSAAAAVGSQSLELGGGKDTQGRSGWRSGWRLLLSSGETKSQQGIQIISSGPCNLVIDEHVGKVVFLVNGNKN